MASQHLSSRRLLRLATRGSALAMWQAARARETLLRAAPGLNVRVLVMRTSGDRLSGKVRAAGGKGLFVKEIEDALLAGRADVAVHSLKDMPARLPSGLVLGGVLRRADPRDALVSRSGRDLRSLPPNPRVGTGSPRRAALLLRARPDVRIMPLAGNVPTRLRRLAERRLDAIVLAGAGLDRLGFSGRIAERLSPRSFVPSPGQGIVALECRAGDRTVRRLLAAVTHRASWTEARAERALLRAVGGDCNLPLGGLARLRGGNLTMHGFFLAEGDPEPRFARIPGSARFPERAGRTLARALLAAPQ
jgi:hydroxymethylbilane synthase